METKDFLLLFPQFVLMLCYRLMIEHYENFDEVAALNDCGKIMILPFKNVHLHITLGFH